MTAKTERVLGFFIDEAMKWGARTMFGCALLIILAVATPLWDQVKAIWTSPAAIADLAQSVRDMRTEVQQATGEDRVIRQPPGLSYVEEPVRQGENIVLWLTVQRTTLGRECRLSDWVPLFTDSSNVPIPGQRPVPGNVRRQISSDLEKLRIELIPPHILQPGRIEVYLALDYVCGDRNVPDKTDVVTYRLLPGADR